MPLDASRFEHRGARIHNLAMLAKSDVSRVIVDKGQFTAGKSTAWLRSSYNREAHIELKKNLTEAYGPAISDQVAREYGLLGLYMKGKHISGELASDILLRAEELAAPGDIETFMGKSIDVQRTQDAIKIYLYSQIGNKAKVDFALKNSLMFAQAVRHGRELTEDFLYDLLEEVDLDTRRLSTQFIDQAMNIPHKEEKAKPGIVQERVYTPEVQEMINHGKVGGLKAYGNASYAMEKSGIRYDKEGIEQVSDMYAFVDMKDKGVEPGIKARKRFRYDDFRKTFNDPTHKFYQKADEFILEQIEVKDSPIGQFVEGLRKGGAFPAEKDKLLALIKGAPLCQASIIEHITSTEPKFVKIHFIKLDYRNEQEILGKKYVFIPKAQSKGMLHLLGTGKTPTDANFGAVRECLANDMLALLGTFAQKLKIIGTQYDDGTPKLLLDGTFMVGPNGEPFKDFSGCIVDGHLVSPEDADKYKAGQLKEGELIPADNSIEKLGKFKIFMLLLGDRDAIGSRGDNKGRCGNTFAAIDPGHSFEIFPTTKFKTNLMEFQNIHSDFSFDQPGRAMDKLTKGYKNFTVFDDTPYLEKLEGVEALLHLRNSGEDELLFKAYLESFNGIGEDGQYHEELDFRGQVDEILDAYKARRDYILDVVFADRIPFLPSLEKPYGPAALELVDSLEKLTSITSETSPNGLVALDHLRVVERTPWVMGEDMENNVTFTCKTDDVAAVRARLGSLLGGIDCSKIKIEQGPRGIVIRVPHGEVQGFTQVFNEASVRGAKQVHGQFIPRDEEIPGSLYDNDMPL